MTGRTDCAARDAADPLAPLRAQFALGHVDAQDLIYLDGNSLGVAARAAAERVGRSSTTSGASGLIRSWNTAGWIDLSQRIGDKIARLVGAGPGEVIVADSTSVNLYKVLSAAMAMVNADAPARRRIVSERTTFPTDLYIADTPRACARLRARPGRRRRDRPHTSTHRLAILMLTHVNYRTGRMHRDGRGDARGARRRRDEWSGISRTRPARCRFGLHGAGADEAADFAVGCSYKYLNGGPGAPAFAGRIRATSRGWIATTGASRSSGWLGHAAPFAFTPDYRACGRHHPIRLRHAADVCRWRRSSAASTPCSRPSRMAAWRRFGDKSIALTDLFIELVESRCAGTACRSSRRANAADRGSQVWFAHDTGGYAIMQALIARGVIGDFRAPDILRFGFTPLYTRFVDVWDAVDRLEEVLASGRVARAPVRVRAAVT